MQKKSGRKHNKKNGLPLHIHTKLRALRKAEKKLWLSNGYQPVSDEELAKDLRWNLKRVRDYRMYARYGYFSIDSPVKSEDGGTATYAEVIPDEGLLSVETELYRAAGLAFLPEMMLKLPAREERILRLRFGIKVEEHTLEQIGNMLSLSKERIRQLEERALKKLKQEMNTRGMKEYALETV